MPNLTFKSGTFILNKDITGKKLLDEIKLFMPELPDGLTFEDVQVIIGGINVDLREYCINREFWCDVEVIIPPKGVVAIVTAVVVGALAASVLLTPEIPKTPTGAKESPNNSFFGQTNQIRLDDLIPNNYGTVISYPDLAVNEGGAWEYVNNQKIIKEVFLIGTGAYDKEPPKYELTPLETITGSTYQYYEPFATIPVVQGQFNSEFIDGQTLLGPNNDEVTPGLTADTTNAFNINNTGSRFSFVIPGTDPNYADWEDLYDLYESIDSFSCEFSYERWALEGFPPTCTLKPTTVTCGVVGFVRFGGVGSAIGVTLFGEFPQGSCDIEYTPNMTLTELEGGFLNVTLPIPTNEVQVSFDFRNGLRGTAEIGILINAGDAVARIDETFTYSANTSDQKYFSEKIAITPTAEPVKITLFRFNNDKDDNTDRCQVSQCATNEYRNNASYGNNTMLTTERKATEQATKFVESKINAKITRKTVSYDLGTGQIIPTLTASRSFADAILHEYTEVQGLPASDLPLDELYTIEDSLPTGLGNFDFTFSDKEASIKERLDTIANVARCIIPFTGQGYKIFRDEQRFPVAQFDSRNIDASSPEEVSYRGASPTSNDGVKLKWRNPDGNKPEYIYYVIQSGQSVKCVYQGGGVYSPAKPTRPYEIELTGCQTLDQAEDRADVECRKLIFIQKTLSVTTLVDGENVERGQVVKHVDYWTNDITSGEIKSINGNIYESYSELRVDPGDYVITYTDELGTPYGPSAVTVIDKTTFSADLPEAYLADGYLIQCGSRFMISTIEEHDTSLYVVNDKNSDSSGRVQLELVQYDERVYPELDS